MTKKKGLKISEYRTKTDSELSDMVQKQFEQVTLLINDTKNKVISMASSTLIDLYWKIGHYVSDRISSSDWGEGVVNQLAHYISAHNPDVKGFSNKNIWRMKRFYDTYRNANEKVSALLRQISWTNNLTIITRTKSEEEKLFYLELCVHDRLSSRQLDRQII